jgi:hypothetical protein
MKTVSIKPANLRNPVGVGVATATSSVPLKNPVTHWFAFRQRNAISRASAYRRYTGGKFKKWLFVLALAYPVSSWLVANGNRGLNSIFWSSAASSGSNAWKRNFNYANAGVNRNANNRSNGNSVRCVRDSYEMQNGRFFLIMSYELWVMSWLARQLIFNFQLNWRVSQLVTLNN